MAEHQSIGVSLLSGILYRMQSIKLATPYEAHASQRRGKEWVENHNRSVYESQHAFYPKTQRARKAKWEEPAFADKYNKSKTHRDRLAQSRNRLWSMYNTVSDQA